MEFLNIVIVNSNGVIDQVKTIIVSENNRNFLVKQAEKEFINTIIKHSVEFKNGISSELRNIIIDNGYYQFKTNEPLQSVCLVWSE